MHITKRDGRREAFDITKIENAIRKSLDSTGKEYPGSLPASLAETVASSLSRDKEWSVEEIQDAAEKTSHHSHTAGPLPRRLCRLYS